MLKIKEKRLMSIHRWSDNTSNGWKLLAIAVLLLLAAAFLALKTEPSAAPTRAMSNLPVIQLDQALANHKPVLAFYHSNTCDSCIQMIDIVQQVYPAFAGSVALVDVNVYDSQNQALLKREKIQYIPTLVLYLRSGQSQIFVGVMEPDQLHNELLALSEGP